ncbi:hypothetical protein [Nocardioides pakistanensis]
MSIMREVRLGTSASAPDGPDLPRPGLVVALIGLFVLLAAALGAVLTAGSPARIIAIADEFTPDPRWARQTGRVTPPRLVCLGASPCPSLFRSWTADASVTEQGLSDLIAHTAWSLGITCTDTGTYDICAGTGVVDRFVVTVKTSGQDGRQTVLTLDVRRHEDAP